MTSKELGIFNQKPFFFWVKDAEGTYLWVNDALNEMAEEGVEGKKDTELPWADAAEFLKRQPGYINTKLHQSILPDSKFQFINVAEWETPESFFDAIKTEEFQKITEGTMEAYPHHPSLYKRLLNINSNKSRLFRIHTLDVNSPILL